MARRCLGLHCQPLLYHTRAYSAGLYQGPQIALRFASMAASGAASASQGPKVVDKQTLAESKFLRFVDIKYVRPPHLDQVRSWQACERTTRDPTGGIDAVSVFATIAGRGDPQLIIVKQYRPPLDKFTIELCAGLVDKGETVEEAALRELKEETGYTGKVVGKTGQCYLSPGLTNENIVTVIVEVDGEAPENQHPPQCDEDSEMIKVELIPLKGLYDTLERLESEGYGIFVGLQCIAQGMRLTSQLGV